MLYICGHIKINIIPCVMRLTKNIHAGMNIEISINIKMKIRICLHDIAHINLHNRNNIGVSMSSSAGASNDIFN